MPRPDTDLPQNGDVTIAEPTSSQSSAGTAREAADRLAGQVREQMLSLKGQAGEKLMSYAGDGKDRATNLLDDISAVIEDAARSIEQRLGAEYGGYAHRAAEAVAGFSGKVRDKSVDDLLDDGREIVRKSPGVAIAAAAVVGFALVRVLRSASGDSRPANDEA
ncbi:hypothetical protein GCM10023232_06290 [Sphingosinicella ginsenosidimutans]|uniref:DUF883 family protein n=1 Tax=Allosphingosinicella ginsenosidimutans TaxID=1176539 RepID=A0A5C6TWD2_9SPHN|nr:hypothetical protein [Sphingosinicella ginsenosidimutans]TXC64470.1 hypothetical protein FRZ32_12890 [Sphingosinicella ginsenosidimutans]